MSADYNEVAFFTDEERAEKVATVFVQMALVNPSPDNAAFSERLRDAWLTSAEKATEAAVLADVIQHPALSVGVTFGAAAAAAGELFSLPGNQVIALAAAFGAGFTVLATGVVAEHRRRASKADFIRVLNLRREAQDFLIDLAIALMDGVPQLRQRKSENAPGRKPGTESPSILEVLRDELDTRLLPAASERAPNLAVYLEQISHQLRLRAQERPTFDPSILQLAMQAAWQLLEPAESDNSPALQLAARQAVASRPQLSAQPQEITGPPAEALLSAVPAQRMCAPFSRP